MSLIDYYKLASLATAAYVRLGEDVAPGTAGAVGGATLVNRANAQGRLPSSLAESMFLQTNSNAWNLVSYYGGDISDVSDRSGFGAALFQRGSEKVLAVRGTEPDRDDNVDLVSADLGQIGILGLALTQVVSMANYVMRLRAPAGDLVPQLSVRATIDEPASGLFLQAQGITQGMPVYLVFENNTWGTGLGLINGSRVAIFSRALARQ